MHGLQNSIKGQSENILLSQVQEENVLGIVAHDLRAPIANIDQLSDLISYSETTDKEREEFISLIKQSCRQAYSIIEDILSVTAKSQKSVEKSPVDLNNIITTLIKLQLLKNECKQLDIQFNSSQPLLIAKVDASKVERVIDNLINNAIKFTPQKGVIKIYTCHLDGNVHIQIKDSGIGIPETMLPYIFEPFSKARRQGINGEKTVGLGLSIVKNIIEQHDGSISVKSIPSRGTTFKVILPC